MPLIQCPECKTEISDKAPSCVKCGHPMNVSVAANITTQGSNKKKTGLLRNLVGGAILLFIIIYGFKIMGQVKKPLMPVEVKYRRAILANGYVSQFKNTSNRQLTVIAIFSNPTLNNQKSFELVLAPGQSKEVGHVEGWNFASGDTITLEQHDYQNWSGKIP